MFSCVLKHSITQWFPNLVVLLITEKSADMTNDYYMDCKTIIQSLSRKKGSGDLLKRNECPTVEVQFFIDIQLFSEFLLSIMYRRRNTALLIYYKEMLSCSTPN